MTNIDKIRLCSNLLQEPHAFDGLGEVAGAIARDLTIYTAWNNADWVILNLPEFCREFGYKPQHLLKPISEEQQNQLIGYGFEREEVSRYEGARGGAPFSTYIGYTLALMSVRKLKFATKQRQLVDEAGQLATEKRYDTLDLVRQVKVVSSPRGTMIRFAANRTILENCRTRYQTFDLSEYKSLVTKTGQKDDRARRMYLRLVWKRKYWDKARKVAGVRPSEDSYVMLKKVAGLNFADEAKNASILRKLLNQIGAIKSVSMSATVTLCPMKQQYEVKFKRETKTATV